MSQGQRVGQYIVAHLEAADPLTDRANYTTGRHAQCHWRLDPDIPTSGANDFIPVGCTCGSDFNDNLIRLRVWRGRQLPKLHFTSHLTGSTSPPSPIVPCTTPIGN